MGIGLHTTQTVGLALATDLAAPQSQPKVVGLMYVMLLAGTIVSAMLFGTLLAEFSPGRLIQVIQGAAVATLVLNGVALWKQETLGRFRPGAAPAAGGPAAAPPPSFRSLPPPSRSAISISPSPAPPCLAPAPPSRVPSSRSRPTTSSPTAR